MLWCASAIALAAFAVLYVLQLKSMLLDGTNRTPLHILVSTHRNQPAANDIRIAAVTQWSELQLSRSGNVWGFPEGKIRNAPRITVQFTDPGRVSDHRFYVSTARSAPAIGNDPVSAGWFATPLIADTDVPGLYRLDTQSIGQSWILKILGRPCINWGGDLMLLLAAAAVPATQVGSVWLTALGFLWFYGAMKTTPMPQRHSHTSPDSGRSGRIEGLDHLRGCAILMVCAYHCLYATFGFDQLGWNGWFRDFNHNSRTFLTLAPVTFGFGGVAVFFAISGFCIHLSHQRSSNKNWLIYLWRRLFRIYPPFLVALLFFAFCFPLTVVDFSANGLRQFYSRVFLYFNLSQESYWGINSSFWSVAVEMQLYLVYPFLLVAAKRLGWRPVLILAFLLEIGLKIPSSELRFLAPDLRFPFAMLRGPLGYVFSWLIGAKLADDYVAGRPLTFRRVPMLVWLSLLFLSLTFKPAYPFHFILFSLTTVGVIARCAQGRAIWSTCPSLLSRHLAWIGTISYSVYLLHQPFLNAAPKIVVWMNGGHFVHPVIKLLSCVAMYPLILWLSEHMYRFVELPSIRAGKWFILRTTGRLQTAGSVEATPA